MYKEVDLYIKLYPVNGKGEQEDNGRWIDKQQEKQLSLKIDREAIDENKFQDVAHFLIKNGYTAVNRNTFIKILKFDELKTEEFLLYKNFNITIM